MLAPVPGLTALSAPPSESTGLPHSPLGVGATKGKGRQSKGNSIKVSSRYKPSHEVAEDPEVLFEEVQAQFNQVKSEAGEEFEELKQMANKAQWKRRDTRRAAQNKTMK
ncbi:hypothetical protein BD413DRAFT_611758 [Trametes elegans]|nr:hypothetical protein BD413DRAFT_611758 [Trametes elegans]